MQKMMLAFNFTPERLQALRMVAMLTKIQLRVISRQDMSQTLGALAGVPGMAKTAEVYSGNEAQEEMLYLCGLNGPTLDKLLQAIKRSALKQVALKSMLTPTNVGWTPVKLIGELAQEHAYMSQQGKGAKPLHNAK